jgi:D-amino-acid dehydrogenase
VAKRGRSVVVVDRRGVGEEASFGNAGLIERSAIMPYLFPRSVHELLHHALKLSTASSYHTTCLPAMAPWLFRYWQNSSPDRALAIALANLALFENCVTEHRRMATESGVGDALRPVGWIKVYDTARNLAAGIKEAQVLDDFGIRYDVLDPKGLAVREPHLSDTSAGGVHFLDPLAVQDPGAMTKAYARHAESLGVTFVEGDAKSLNDDGGRWSVVSDAGSIEARDAVIALGAWSADVTSRLGYRIPLAVKRGYHRHFLAKGNAVLERPIVHAAGGFVIVPTNRGLRLTTGAEFANRDAAPTPVQLSRIEPLARNLFPIGEPIDGEFWMGSRPCLPDMTPVIGQAPRHKGLWFAFGHAHHGFTNGPATGRLLAEMIARTAPFINPAPFSAMRFMP